MLTEAPLEYVGPFIPAEFHTTAFLILAALGLTIVAWAANVWHDNDRDDDPGNYGGLL